MKHVDRGKYTEGHHYTPAEKASTPLTAFAGKEKQKKSAVGLTGKLPIYYKLKQGAGYLSGAFVML